MKKKIATYFVILTSLLSKVLPLFFPKKVSAPPAIAPESPADLPSCKSTRAIIAIEDKISKTLNKISYHNIGQKPPIFNVLQQFSTPKEIFQVFIK